MNNQRATVFTAMRKRAFADQKHWLVIGNLDTKEDAIEICKKFIDNCQKLDMVEHECMVRETEEKTGAYCRTVWKMDVLSIEEHFHTGARQ